MLIQTQGRTREEQQLDTDDALLTAYRDHFGIELSRVPDGRAGILTHGVLSKVASGLFT